MELRIEVTWRRVAAIIGGAFGFAVILLGGGWAVISMSISGVVSDVGSINQTLATLHQEDKTLRSIVAGTDLGLREKIEETRLIVGQNQTALAENKVRIEAVQRSVDELRTDVRAGFGETQRKLDILVEDRLKNPKH